MSPPEVSILMLSYNHGRFVGQAIESVLDQTFQNWQLVVVDDASPDDSWEVIGRYTDPRIHRTRFESNRGASAAYETARALCIGKYLAHLDSDDAWAPTKLARQYEQLEAQPEVGISCTRVVEIDQEGQETGHEYSDWFNVQCDLSSPESWIWQNRVCRSSVLMRRSLHDGIGAIDADLVHTPDYQLWVRCLRAGGKIARIDDLLTIYRGHGGNITRKNPARKFREMAFISASALHPWFYECGRPDLVALDIHQFMQQPDFHSISVEERQAMMHLLCGREREQARFSGIFDGTRLKAREEDVRVDAVVVGLLGERYSPSGLKLSDLVEKRSLEVEKLKADKARLKERIREMEAATERRRLKNRLGRALGLWGKSAAPRREERA